MDGHRKARWVKALLRLQHHWVLFFQASPKVPSARGPAEQHRASNGTGEEESAEHSPASRMACVLPAPTPPLLYCNCNEQFIFWLNTGKCQVFSHLPGFPAFREWSWAGMRPGQGQSLLLLKWVTSSIAGGVGLLLCSKPQVPHTAPTCLAALGSLGDRNGNMDVRQTHTAAYVWLPVGWHETRNLTQSVGAKPMQWASTEETHVNTYENGCRSFP